MYWVSTMSDEQSNVFSNVAGNAILLTIIVAIVVAGAIKKVSVFDTFIEGAKEGFGVVLKIIPYLVGMLVAITIV